MLRDLKNNNNGVVFITVLIIVIVTMILAISALSLNISQIKNTENELKHIQDELLYDGALARFLINQFSSSPSNTIIYPETVGNTTFSIVANIEGGSGPIGSNSIPLDITVSF
jgi:hypothetical protein